MNGETSGKKQKRMEKRRNIQTQIHEHKAVFAVYVILRIIVIASLALAIIRGEYESAFVCVLALILFLLPHFLERTFVIDIPDTLEIIILLFIFAAEILGELQNYYIQYPHWDVMLHTVNGFLCAAVGFSLVDILCRNKQDKFRLSPLYMAIVAFCFSMTVGVLWEFFEYGMDCIFHTDMQKDTVIHTIHSVALDPTATNTVVTLDGVKSVMVNGVELGHGGYIDIGLIDTMNDLMVNFVGAVVFSIIGFFYIKQRGRGKAGRFARHFIPTIAEEPTDEQTGSDSE